MTRRAPSTALLTLASALLLGGCATPYPHAPQYRPAEPVTAGQSDRQHLIRLLHGVVGTPYRYGGASPHTGFDCSGLIYWASRHAGYRGVPRTVREQYRQLRRVPLDRLRPGDILFFRFHPGPPTHDGVYIGRGRFIHAPATGDRVSIARLDSRFWSRHLIAAARLPR
ncbi:C40 family peptidase [Acidihalobacter prosperus]|uniref:NlpC/P60 domain-containing protein n=1 Tax=Acidihalobacter prosperus TaxID=160660 RepID=A0A1A6C7I1_9GAMM|nr:C40 family peptidase [Acidihalobacter prosperus]OBS10504.1 hypothetical protein Thpro_020220 [Acidihalobacter prosperus]